MKTRQVKIMERIGVVISLLTLVGSLGFSIADLWGAEGVIRRVPVPGTNYCRLRFPAIREETLYWDRPVLKDPSDSDIVDLRSLRSRSFGERGNSTPESSVAA